MHTHTYTSQLSLPHNPSEEWSNSQHPVTLQNSKFMNISNKTAGNPRKSKAVVLCASFYIAECQLQSLPGTVHYSVSSFSLSSHWFGSLSPAGFFNAALKLVKRWSYSVNNCTFSYKLHFREKHNTVMIRCLTYSSTYQSQDLGKIIL